MSRMWTIMRKEFIHILRDPRTLGLVVALPVLSLLLLSYAVARDIENIPLVVADLSKTDVSRRFIDRYWLSGFFRVAYEVDSESELLQLIDSGKAKAGLLVPEDFHVVSVGGASAVPFYIDGSDPTLAQAAQLAAETIGQVAAQDILVEQLSDSPLRIELRLPVDTRFRFLYNPDMRRLNFAIPGLVACILQVQALLLTSSAIVREREQGTLEQLIVTPIKPWELMLGKILPFVLVTFVNVGLILAVARFWFQVPIAGSITQLLMLTAIFLLGSLGLGVLISNISRTQMQAMYLAAFSMMPTLILSGFIYPRDNMHWIAYYAGYLLPITFYLDIMRGIILKGIGASMLWPSIWPMVVFSVVVFVASVLVFHKRVE